MLSTFIDEGDHEQQRADREDRSCSRTSRTGMSPEPACAMKAVIVCIASSGFQLTLGADARGDRHDHRLADRPGDRRARRRRRCRTARPGRRPGRDTCILVEPSAYAPSRRRCGTADMASSDSEAIVGMIMTPITMPAARRVEDVRPVADRPDVPEQRGDEGQGEEAVDHGRDAGQDLQHRLEDLARTPGRGVLAEVDRRAQPERDRDQRSRSTVITSVPTSSGSTPKLGGSNSGDQSVPVKNSPKRDLRKNSIVGGTSEMTMPTVVSDRHQRGERTGRPGSTRSP